MCRKLIVGISKASFVTFKLHVDGYLILNGKVVSIYVFQFAVIEGSIVGRTIELDVGTGEGMGVVWIVF